MGAAFPELILDQLAILLLPLQRIPEASDPNLALQRFLRGAGWKMTAAAVIDDVVDTVDALLDAVALLRADPIPDSLEEALELLQAVAELVDSVRSLGTTLAELGDNSEVPDPTAAALLAGDIAHFLVLSRMAREPVLYTTLELLGFVDTVEITETSLGGWLIRREGVQARIVPEALTSLLSDPVGQLVGTLVHDGWAAPTDAIATNLMLFNLLQPGMAALGGSYRLHPNLFRDPGGIEALGRKSLLGLKLSTGGGGVVELGVVLELLSAADKTPENADGPAVTLAPYGSFSDQLTAGKWTIGFDANASLGGDADEPAPAFTVGVNGVEAQAGLSASLAVDASRALDLAIGGANTGLQLGTLGIGVHAGVEDGEPDYGFSVVATDSSVGLSTADFGSAIGSLAPFEASLDFDLGVGWSRLGGLTLAGEASLEIPLGKDISIGGIVTLTDFVLRVDVSDTIDLAVTAGLGLYIGPLSLIFDGLGLGAGLEFGVPQGNLGSAQLDVSMVRPTGIGVGLETDVASGGGLITVDYDAGEYAGVLSIAVFEVGLTAVALIATQLPSGASGWSMLLSLSATFPAIQLGFGFTLNGVGGLIGANRGLDEDALADGVRTGALDSILFPEDPIRDALQILSDMDAVFPVAEGQWVFGPVCQIGWGGASIIVLEVGIIVQLPDPLTISLLGSLSCILPADDAAVLELRIDVAGTLNLTEGTLKIDASIRDSHVAGFPLTGDVAIRAAFLGSPSLILSFGGFHPDFPPPDDFPVLNRLGIALDTGDNLRVQLGGYFAVTSNTLQFGAMAEFWASAAGFTATGGTSFDALIQFKPFGFTISLEVWVDIDAGSVELLAVLLAGKLTGPNPWYVEGKASFKILGIKASLEVSATFGQAKDQAPRDVVTVETLLLDELRREEAWSVLGPDGDADPVVVGDTTDGALSVHPAGRIEVTQRVAPLGTRIDHYGEATLGGSDTFALTAPKLGTVTVDTQDALDWFAAGQYWHLTEDEKLSAPSFEELPAGLRLGDDGIEAAEPREFTRDHEVIVRDPNVRAAEREQTGQVVSATLTALERAVRFGSALKTRAAAGLPRSTAPTSALTVSKLSFTAIETDTGALAEALSSAEGQGFRATRDLVAGATDGAARAVVPAYELEYLA